MILSISNTVLIIYYNNVIVYDHNNICITDRRKEDMKITIEDEKYVVIEGSELLYEQEKDTYTDCWMVYVATENGLVLINRTVSSNDDEIERYPEDYIDDTPELGKKFSKNEKVTLNKLRYPDAPDIIYIEEPSCLKEEKAQTTGWWSKHWNNLYALRYIKEDGNIDYYSYDMVHERYIERLE